MKFSVITAVYNNKRHIEACIDSVLAQSYKDIEHILVDGGSDDGTVEQIQNSKSKIRNCKFVSEKDDGIYDALNKGIKLAEGDVIGFLHSDDVFYDGGVIEKIAGVFESADTDSVYSDLVYVHRNNVDKVIRYWKAGEFNYSLLRRGWMPPHPAFFVKKKIYDKYGGFDTSYKIAADYELVLRFLAKYRISTSYFPEVSVRMCTGGVSNKSFSSIRQKSLEDYRTLRHSGFSMPVFTLICKNVRKLSQFLVRDV